MAGSALVGGTAFGAKLLNEGTRSAEIRPLEIHYAVGNDKERKRGEYSGTYKTATHPLVRHGNKFLFPAAGVFALGLCMVGYNRNEESGPNGDDSSP